MPLVSILIPAYNAERWIAATINSALSQTWRDKEIILVDDGSRDATLEIARRFESKLVKVVSQENRGACLARNRALAYAQGDYIQWLDADDLLAPDKISTQLQQRETDSDDPVLYTSAWGRFYFEPERATFRPDPLWSDLEPVDWIVAKFECGVWMNPTTWLVSRKLTEIAGPWDARLALSGDDDGEYVCRLVAASAQVRFSPQSRCYYRVGNASGLSWRRSERAADSFLLATALSISHLLSLEDSNRTRASCLKLLQRRLHYLWLSKPELVVVAEGLAANLGGRLRSVSLNQRFRFVSNLVGLETALKVRSALWLTEVALGKNLERAINLVCKLSARKPKLR